MEFFDLALARSSSAEIPLLIDDGRKISIDDITDEITSAIVNQDCIGVIAIEEFSEVESKS